MSDCTECGWPVATDADNDRPCDDHCDHCRGLCWHEFTGAHRDDVRPDTTIATLTHRAEAAERACEDAKRREQETSAKMQAMAQSESNKALRFRVKVAEQSAALWRERCNKAEQKADALALDKSVLLGQLRESEESECSLRAKVEAVRPAEQLRAERDAWHRVAEERTANYEAAVRDGGELLAELTSLRAKFARAEGVVGHMRDIAEHECAYRDGCPTFGSRHGQCTGCKAREALATYEEG